MIPLVRPWKQRPTELVCINWDCPTARGLVRLLVPSGVNLLDLVTGQFATRVGSAFALEGTPDGLAVRTTGIGAYWTVPVRSEARDALSIGWIGKLYAGEERLVMRDSQPSGGTIVHWSNSGWDARVGGTDYTAAGTFATSTPYAAMLTASTTAVQQYVRGQGRVINGGVPGATNLQSPWQIHYNPPGLANTLASTVLLPIWDRALGENEVLSWLADPWQLLEPQRIWVPVSAGGGTNASVTLTGCSAASAAGTTVALGSATAALSGASSAASAGTVTASAGSSASITLSGASSASAAGAVAASAGASVTVVGSAASSAAGALTATAGGNAVATLTGASATSTAGSLTAGGSAGISLAGVGAAGAAGAVTATAGGAASVTLTGASASAAAGILAGFGGAQITLTGASASGAAGSASASAGSGSGTGATAAEIWSYTLSSGLTAEATLVAIHTMLSELHLIHGLTAGSPLSVTAASRAAGAVSQAVAEAAGTVTVTRQ